VKRLIKNLFQRITFKIPDAVLKGFTDTFHNSINIEWTKTGKVYEALFYENELEKIARFDKKGKLIEIRTNIAPNSITGKVKSAAVSIGEVMNVIEIKRSDEILYEIIVRENPVKRILLLFNEQAELLTKKVL